MHGHNQVVVIGAGAAGVFAAIAAAEQGAQVRVLERTRQPLGKVKISGGGRCNVTHACFEPATLIQFYPRGGVALRGPFTRFGPRETVEWFEARGVRLKTEADGRIFPTTDDSQTIIDCLLTAARRAGVQFEYDVHVTAIEKMAAGFALELSERQPLHAERLLLATGSNAQGWAWAKQLGHTLTPPVPSLFTFNIKDKTLNALAGISVPNVHATLTANEQTFVQAGPLLITHWGVSGPAILKLSAWAARALNQARYRATVQINWWPARTLPAVLEELQALKRAHPKRRVLAEGFGPMPQRLWVWLARTADVAEEARWAELSKSDLQRLAERLGRCELAVSGKGVFKDEFVTCGGVDLDEVNFRTLESRVCPGLYFAGEVLDSDGLTGGFNFQNAWTTGWLAGMAMGDVIR
jgi:hypothetical protein